MAAEESWQPILERIGALERDPPPALVPAVERLRTLVTAQPRPVEPATASLVVTMVEEMERGLRRGEPLARTVEAARGAEVRFEQQYDDVQTVFNARKILLNFVLPDARPPAPSEPATTPVPVVLLVMTRADADEIADGRAFARYPDLRADFDSLRHLLGDADWAARYGDEPTAWQPFEDGGPTIRQLVAGAVARVNEHLGIEPPLAPVFLDTPGVLGLRRDDLRLLRQEGCLVVIDTVSMRHPRVQLAYYQAMLDAYPRTAVVAVAPGAKVLETARRLKVVLQLELADLEFAKRHEDIDNEFICIETGERQMLERWLASRVLDMGRSAPGDRGIRRFMRIGPRSLPAP